MNDVMSVGLGKAVGDLNCNVQAFDSSESVNRERLRQCRSGDERHNDKAELFRLGYLIDLANIRVLQ